MASTGPARWFWAWATCVGLACTPTFDDAACFGPGECGDGARCVDRRCVRTVRIPDAEPIDAGPIDAGPVDAVTDTGPVGREDRVIPAPADAVGFAHAVVALGDMNGDGFTDLAVSDRHAVGPACLRACGRVTVYRGTADGLDPEPWAVIDGAVDDERLGSTVAGGAVVGGDDFADLVIGDHRGVIRIIAGGPDGPPSGAADRIAALTLDPPPAPETRPVHFARAAALDFDGDGSTDLARATVSYVTDLRCLAPLLGTAAHLHVRVDFGGADGLDLDRPPWIADDPTFGPTADRCACTNNGGRVCHMGRHVLAAPGPAGDRLAISAPGWNNARGRTWVLDHAAPAELIDGPCPGQNSGWTLAALDDPAGLLELRNVADCAGAETPALLRHTLAAPPDVLVARLLPQTPSGAPTDGDGLALGVARHPDGTARGALLAQASGLAWWVPLPEGEPMPMAALPDLLGAALLEHGPGGPAFAVLARATGLHLVPLPAAR